MRVRILPSAPEQPRDRQFLTSFLINDTVAIDAGCAGLNGDPRDQARIRHVFLSHSHADHLLSLPMLAANVFDEPGAALEVHAGSEVLECLRTDVFNGRIWPDFLAMSKNGRPFLSLSPLQPERAAAVEGLRVTPVPVDHVVPTYGYVVDDGTTAVVFCSDSAPTRRIWQVALATGRLTTVFRGVAFPDSMIELAEKSAHLTPRLFAGELEALPADVQIIAVHIKAGHRATVVAELDALHLPNVSVGAGGKEYDC